MFLTLSLQLTQFLSFNPFYLHLPINLHLFISFLIYWLIHLLFQFIKKIAIPHMSTIRIRTRGNNSEELLTGDRIITIRDIKQKINSKDPSSVLLTFQDKILIDEIEISSLGEDCTFILENDIEFSHIYGHSANRYKAKIDGKSVFLNESDVFFKDGKAYLITNRIKKLKLADLFDQFRKQLTRAQVLQFLFLTFIISSRNYPLICIICFINLLKLISQLILKFRAWEILGNGPMYAFFMFFASFMAIDHNKFINRAISSQS